MNWDAIGAIGEVLGAIGVVASLLYVARQMHQNNANQRAAAKIEMTRQFMDFSDMLMNDTGLAELHNRGLRGEELTEDEEFIFQRLMAKSTWYFSTMFYLVQQHGMTDDDWEESYSVIRWYCRMPGYVRFWRNRERAHGADFLAFMDAEIKRQAASDAPHSTGGPGA